MHPDPLGDSQSPWATLLDRIQKEEKKLDDRESEMEKKIAELEKVKASQTAPGGATAPAGAVPI